MSDRPRPWPRVVAAVVLVTVLQHQRHADVTTAKRDRPRFMRTPLAWAGTQLANLYVAASPVGDTIRCSCCLRHPYRVTPRGLYTDSVVATSNATTAAPAATTIWICSRRSALDTVVVAALPASVVMGCRWQDDGGKEGDQQLHHDPIVAEQAPRGAQGRDQSREQRGPTGR